MFSRVLLSIVAALLLTLPAVTQEEAVPLAYDGFQMTFPAALADGLNLWNYPADALDAQYPGGPQPAHTQFMFYTGTEAADHVFAAPTSVFLYRLDALSAYEEHAAQAARLRALLEARPDLNEKMAYSFEEDALLPYLPVTPAAQVIRARAQYVETPGFEGIAYLASFRLDVWPFTGRDFVYTFQGLSRDGRHYVSAQFWLNTELFPAEIVDLDYDAFSQNFEAYMNETIATLNAAAPGDFTPSLDTLDAIIASFSSVR